MKKSGLITMFLALPVLAGGWFWFNFYRIAPEQTPKITAEKHLHFGGQPDKPLSQITVKAFYFVPADQTPEAEEAWKKQLDSALSQTAKFYKSQLGKNLNITWNIFPEEVRGKQTAAFYDTDDSSRGNPHALISIRQELLENFPSLFPDKSPSTIIIAVLYQGVGSSATWFADQDYPGTQVDVINVSDNFPPALLVSDFYFTGESYKDYGTSIFAHEFGHTLGLVDGYSLTSGQAITDDIMGSGRFRPLNYTYLSLENKKLLGLEH